MTPTLCEIKPAFQSLLRPVVRMLGRAGVTANQVTLSALGLSIGAGWLLAISNGPRALLVLPPVLALRMALNALDGMLARELQMQSRLGAVLNELGDVTSDIALYLPLAFAGGFTPWLLTLLLVLAVTSEMAGVLGRERHYHRPLGKSDRALVFGAMALALGCGAPTGVWQDFVLSGLAVLTIFNRARAAIQESK